MVQLTPSVFIGIGTSGMEIISSVRELIYEEFLSAGLPSIRFAHITTHQNWEPYALNNSRFEDPWQKIAKIDISMSRATYTNICSRVMPNSPNASPEIAAWLNPMITQIPNADFTVGAGLIRQAGRLGLWANYDSFDSKLGANLNNVLMIDSSNQTNKIIQEYLSKKTGRPVQGGNYLNQRPTVFIVGSLCGGTCSGTFLDVAYYIRRLYSQYEIIGVFTVPDAIVAGNPSNQRQSANAFAALKELDYFFHDGTEFAYTFPNMNTPYRTIDKPFDYSYIITTRNRNDSFIIAADPSNGTMDLKHLHRMIATSLFVDVVGGAGTSKSSIRVNWKNSAAFTFVNTKPRYTKSFSSFGSTAVWYPKSRISGAASAKYLRLLAENWLGDPDKKDYVIINSLVQELNQAIIEEVQTQLSTIIVKGDKTSVRADWSLMMREIEESINADESVDTLLYRLTDNEQFANPRIESNTGSLAARFKRNGYYYKKLDQNSAQIAIALKSLLIEKLFIPLINKMFSEFWAQANPTNPRKNPNLVEIEEIITQLSDRFANQPGVSDQLASMDLSFAEIQPNLTQLRKEQSRKLTAIAGCRPRIVKQHTDRIVSGLHYILQNAEYHLLTYFIGKVLRDNQIELTQKLKSLYKEAVDRVKAFNNIAGEMYNELIVSSSTPAIAVVTKKSLIADIDDFYQQLIVNTSQLRVVLSGEMSRMLQADLKHDTLYSIVSGKLQSEILLSPQMTSFSLFESVKPAEWLEYARNSQPMFHAAAGWMPITYGQGNQPTQVAGDTTTITSVLALVNPQMANSGFSQQLDSGFNHLFTFYQEEGGLAISELDTYSPLKKHYDSKPLYGVHIDHDEDKFDIELFLDLNEIIQNDLFPRIFDNMLFDSIFDQRINSNNSELLKLQYSDSYSNNPRDIFFNPKDPGAFKKQLRANKEALKEIMNRYHRTLETLDRTALQSKINEEMIRFSQQTGFNPATEQYINEEAFYYNWLDKVKPIPSA